MKNLLNTAIFVFNTQLDAWQGWHDDRFGNVQDIALGALDTCLFIAVQALAFMWVISKLGTIALVKTLVRCTAWACAVLLVPTFQDAKRAIIFFMMMNLLDTIVAVMYQSVGIPCTESGLKVRHSLSDIKWAE